MYLFKKLRWFLKEEKKEYIIAIASLIIVSILNLVPPIIIGNVIDAVNDKNLSKEDLLWNVGLLLLSALSMYYLRYIWRLNLFGAASRLGQKLRFKLYRHFTKMSPSFYQKYRTGDLMAHATNDINAVTQTAGAGVMSAVDASITALVTLITMFFMISWKLTLLVIIPLPLLAFATNRIGKKIHDAFKQSQASFSDLNNNVQEAVTGMKVTKSFVYGQDEIEKFNINNDYNYMRNIKTMKYDVLFAPVIVAFVGLCYLISLAIGGYFVSKSEMTVGNLVTFITYLDMLIWPLLAMGFLFNVIQRGNASYERIEKLLEEVSDVDPNENSKLEVFNGKLTYNIENFSYQDDNTVLSNVNFSIEKGQTLGIVGPTGSGKTSLLRLLLRERDVNKGYIRLNNKNIEDYKLSKLRSLIAYVPQDQILFSTSIMDNIKFANTSISEEEVFEAAKLSGIYKDILDMPESFGTLVGERGVSLSGGQKQRIAIARALVMNPEILILDDSLSAVDAKTEDLILNNLAKLRAGKTNIITAHRLSSVVNADLIIVMSNGRILEKGRHEDLLANKSWYYETYNKQQIENILEGGNDND
ncbi:MULTISPECIES: ABC transporter ATP-binding protein [unclassified Gemella]|uniref:ABC transporter ATP-binding protein n=1 Tax=unclassified Gemella TaxID=2624949 RepID=UPI0015D04913|nr:MULTISPECIES: ABC transporter transmembrane domain-containing protein [unclassified Gemella]MBF0710316.1 ATP-binding cassette domain-containing protein [Gemella sp. GL1.1]NYS27660.1 ATP-binding cassette domain-containing protein [Gemella sp. GL1]